MKISHNHLVMRLLSVILFCGFSASALAAGADSTGSREPFDFIENLGQWHPEVRFVSHQPNATVFLLNEGITYVVQAPAEEHGKHAPEDGHVHHHKMRYHAFNMHFVTPLANDLPQGIGVRPGYDNYFIGRDRSRWRSYVKHYDEVLYRNFYRFIDLRCYISNENFEYDFIVHPLGLPQQIVFSFDGAEGLSVQPNGNLLIKTSCLNVEELRPVAFQMVDGVKVNVPAKFLVVNDQVHIVLGEYHKDLDLVIDPQLVFSTYTGSSPDNWGTTATFDSHKNVYSAGIVFGVDYPTSVGAFDTTYNGNADLGIFKFDSAGSHRIFATYLGGEYADMPHSMFVNSFDELVIFGTTGSSQFPVTPNAYDSTFNGGQPLFYEFSGIPYPNGSDLFVSRISEDGASLLASTYVGGSNNDGLNFRHIYNADPTTLMFGTDSLYYNYGDGARGELITDDQNNVYVGTTTFSSDFPTTAGAVQPVFGGGQEGVVFKLDYNLSNMLWSTYLGGSGQDAVYSIEVDKEYNLLACGGTSSRDFPTTPGTLHPTYLGGNTDGFVCKIDYHGNSLLASTFFGSSEYDQCYFVRCGRESEVFIFGQTKAPGSTLVHNAMYNVPNSGQFIARIRPNLDTLVWSTVFGTGNGRPNISPTAFGADICNRVYAVGWGRDFVGYYNRDHYVGFFSEGTTGMQVTPDAFQSTTDGQDFYIMSLSLDASHLDYATFFGEINDGSSRGGGDHVDGGTSRFDRGGTLYQAVCGSCGGSNGFPTTAAAWSRSNNSSNCNNAVFRFNIHEDFPVAEFAMVPTGCAPYRVEFQNMGRGSSFLWDFGDGSVSTERNPVHTYTRGGQYTIKLKAFQRHGCSEIDSTEQTFTVVATHSQHNGIMASCTSDPMQIGFAPQLGCSYRWVQGSVTDPTIANPYVDAPGTYVLQISLDPGCLENDTFEVVYYSILDSLAVANPTCNYTHDGKAVAFPNHNARGTIYYEWDGRAPSTSNSYTGLPSSDSIHTLRISDAYCSATRRFVVSQPAPQVSREVPQVLCNDCSGAASVNYACPGRSYSYQWSDGATGATRHNLCRGSFLLTVTDNEGCVYLDTFDLQMVSVFDSVRVWAADTLLMEGQSTSLNATKIAGASYHWRPESMLDNPASRTPIATPVVEYDPYSLSSTNVFYVTITDVNGCSYTDSVSIRSTYVDCGRHQVAIPNAFSPNGDGMNDRLCFKANYVTDFHIAIFSRWGEKVFETSDINDSWDGRYKNNFCLPGVYMYTCTLTCQGGITNQLKGDVTLVR